MSEPSSLPDPTTCSHDFVFLREVRDYRPGEGWTVSDQLYCRRCVLYVRTNKRGEIESTRRWAGRHPWIAKSDAGIDADPGER